MSSLDSVTPAFSVQLLNFAAKDPGVGGFRFLLAQARAADAAGVDRLVVSDHVVMGENLDAYGDPSKGGTKGGKQPTGPDGQWIDPIILLSMVAAQTTHTRLLTGILIAGLRRPANLAKQIATLDCLSEGRVDLGVGVGWQREEYEANGVPWEHRGARLDETLEICQKLWTEEGSAHKSGEYDFAKVHCNPKPAQPGGVPLWISGRLNKNVLQRIARFGSGWIPWGDDAMNPVAGLAKIGEEMSAAGRDMKGFQCTSYAQVKTGSDGAIDVPATMAPIAGMAEAGITDIRFTLQVPEEEAAATDFFAPLVEAFRKAVGR